MVSDIKEVLHLYYGCEFEHEDDFCSLTRHKLDGRMIDRWNDNCVLLLRPLKEITREELLELCKIYYATPFTGLYQDKWEVLHQSVGKHKPTEYALVQNEKKKATFCVEMSDGTVTFEKENIPEPQYSTALCMLFCLKNGFDIFNLINRKLAQKWEPARPKIYRYGENIDLI